MHFIRCILPNVEKQNKKFEDNFVLRQLVTSSSISYAKFIRFGYSKHVKFEHLPDEFKLLENKFGNRCSDRTNFYSKILQLIGLRLNDFKIGKDEIFFRSNKFHKLETFFSKSAPSSHINEQASGVGLGLAEKRESK